MEGEWASRYGNAMTMEPIATRLYDAHIDYDIVSSDLIETGRVIDHRLAIAEEAFDCLIVPYADHLPAVLQNLLQRLQEEGLPVWFADALPENLQFAGTAVPLEELVPLMRAKGMTDVQVEEGYPFLRIYHAVRDGKDIFMFANEDYAKTVDTTVLLPCSGDYARLDLLSDIQVSGHTPDGSFRLELLPNQSQIVLFGDRADLPDELTFTERLPIEPSFELALADYDNLGEFTPCGKFDHFFNINAPSCRPHFSGKMRYNFRFDAVKKGRRVFLDLGKVGQNATLVLNGVDCGIRISRPYLFDITDAMQDGENIAEVVVSNTLAQRVRDQFSHNLQLSPSGLLGEMAIRYAD
jgi:hypothetical protein